MRWALTKSRNLISIRLLQRLGVKRLIKYVTELGFDTTDYVPELSLALGTQNITPLELAKGYAVIANGGYRVEPYIVQRVEDVADNPCTTPNRPPCAATAIRHPPAHQPTLN